MSENVERSRQVRRIIVYSASTFFFTVLFVALLYGLRPMLLPFILGAFLAYLFKPIGNSFRGSFLARYSRGLSLLALSGAVIYWSVALIKSSLPNEKEKLELKVRLQYRFNDRYQHWLGLNDGEGKGNFIYKIAGAELEPLKAKVIDFIKLNDEERKRFLVEHRDTKGQNPDSDRYYEYYIANLKAQKVDIENLKKITEAAAAAPQAPVIVAASEPQPESSGISIFLNTMSHWIILPLAFLFLLFDKGQILHFFMHLIPNRYFELTHTVIENVDEALGKYIRGTMLECVLVGITLILGFYLCGMEFKIAFLIGAIGGLTNAIPFVGTFIACLIGAAYSLIAEHVDSFLPFINENNLMIAVVGVVIIAHLLDNAIYQPLVVGSAVNIHPLVVILGVFGGSMMFGFAGLIFAIPSIVILKVVTETFFTGLKEYRII